MEIKETQESQRPGRPSAAPKGSNRKEPRLEKLGGKKRFYIIGERERKREQKHNKKCVPASNSLHVVHFGETERQREPFIDDRKNAKYFRPRQTYLRQLQHGPDPPKKEKKKRTISSNGHLSLPVRVSLESFHFCLMVVICVIYILFCGCSFFVVVVYLSSIN